MSTFTMGFCCCLAAIPTNLCCWLGKIKFLWPLAMTFLPWAPLVAVVAVMVLLVALLIASNGPHPVIRVLKGEESFVSFGEDSKGKYILKLCLNGQVLLLIEHK